MSFDDTANKVRRNVVVLSSGIIIASVLELILLFRFNSIDLVINVDFSHSIIKGG